jgi:RecG-like helicase
MNRLLQGDVAPGEIRVVSMAAALMAAGRGEQTAVNGAQLKFLPTSIIRNFRRLNPDGIGIALLTGAMTKKQKE